MPASVDGVHPLLILGGLACLLLVDLLACTLRRVPLAGLPLLTIYSVPVSLLVAGVSWWVFAITAAGFLTMLFLQVNEQLARWGRPLGTEEASDPTGFGVHTGAVRASAGTIGAVATGVAIFLPLLIPTMDLNLLTGGTGSGDGDIVIENPMTDLRRDLTRGDDIPLIQVRTDDPKPEYLRISVLNRFLDNEWSSGDREVPTGQLASGVMPDLQGVSGTIARREFDYDLSMSPNFQSLWLPTQAPITSIDAAGDWRYDVTTMDFLSGEDGLTTAGLRYSMTGVELDLSAESMAQAGSSGGQVDGEYIELPDGFPAVVNNLAFQVTRNAVSRFEKAQVLQDWFRQEGGFTYDLNADEGNGTDDLVRFLTDGEGGRVGYCEQFASAMAVMARSVGIPSRVAVGFLEPQRIDGDPGSTAPTTCTPGPSSTSPAPAGSCSSPRLRGAPRGCPATRPSGSRRSVRRRRHGAAPGRRAARSWRQRECLAERVDGRRSRRRRRRLRGVVPDPRRTLRSPVRGCPAAASPRRPPQPAPAAGSAPARKRPGSSFGTPLVTCACPGPPDRSPWETRDLLVEHLGAPLGEDTPERPVHGPEVAPDAVFALDLIVHAVERLRFARAGESSAPPLAGRAGDRGRVPARWRHPACPEACALVAGLRDDPSRAAAPAAESED